MTGASVLEALATENGPPLRRLERNCCFLAALGTDRLCFYALPVGGTGTVRLRAVTLAGLASLRFVFEPFVGKEHLLAGCKNKLCSTVSALQNLIVIFHMLLRDRCWDGAGNNAGPSGKQRKYKFRSFAGRGPLETCQFFKLILLTPLLFTETLTREGLLGAALFTRFHVITVLLDLLDDVFGLNLPLKTP